MTDERHRQLWEDAALPFGQSKHGLAKEELAEGWHWCSEFDGLLIGPEWSELTVCHCLPKNHRVYRTLKKKQDYPGMLGPKRFYNILGESDHTTAVQIVNDAVENTNRLKQEALRWAIQRVYGTLAQ